MNFFLIGNSSADAPKNNQSNMEIVKSQIIFYDQWIRFTPYGAKNTAGYLKVKNNSEYDLKIISADAGDIVAKTEIHGYKPDDNGVMRMYPLSGITVPAKSEVVFKTGSTHVMLMGVKEKLSIDKKYNVKFTIVKASGNDDSFKIEHDVEFPVRKN